MTETVEGATITALPPGRREDITTAAEYLRCTFSGSFSGTADRPTVVEGQVFRECTVEGGTFSDLHVRNCTIDTLTCKRMPQVGNCYFEHVTLRNKIGTILFTGLGAPTDDVAAKRREAEMGFYADVDWALDVTELDAAEFSLKGMVPARLVRHDPLTAGVITLDAARSKDWAAVDLTGTYFGAIIESMTRWSLPDELLVAPRTGPRADSGQRALAELRRRGLLEEPSC